ncbi:MAG: tetratricopeptide repeat protein [Armatimonadetes bacterium]|nr:tetratricopeptide repeat protein [Armatimonadota bacterium]
MRSSHLPALLLLAFLAPLAWAQTPRQKAWELLQTGQELLRAAKYEEAERVFLQARDLDPEYPDVYANLGYLYAERGDRARALEAFGQLLALRPDDSYGRAAFKRLFYDGQFPRSLRPQDLAASPVAFTRDEVRFLTPGDQRQPIAYTTSLLFHEEMKRGGGPVTVPLPVTGNQADCEVNRSVYGFLGMPGAEQLTQVFALSFPSATISRVGKDYQTVASNLVHLLLRFAAYSRTYLGFDLPPTVPVKATMCEQGPTGAESYQEALYFYDVATDRPPVEWARQAAHEMGHLVLPQIGRFSRPEAFASGLLGERLFLQYLALEAGLVAGEAWPAPAAQQALAGLWAGDELHVQDYLVTNCRTSLDYWAAAGPESPLAAGTAEDGMQHFIGFIMWIQAAHGTEVLQATLKGAKGTAPADFRAAFEAALAERARDGSLFVDAGGLNMPASKLAQKPTEGALGRTAVQISPGDLAAFHAYLPEGAWTLLTKPAAPGVTITLDGRGPLPLDEAEGVALGRLTGGWHTISVQLDEGAAPLALTGLVLRRAPEA